MHIHVNHVVAVDGNLLSGGEIYMSKEAMKLALKALRDGCILLENYTREGYEGEFDDAIIALLEALAEHPAQGCEYCNHPLYAGTKCNNCGRVTEQAAIKRDLTPEQPAQQGCMRCNTPKKCALYGCSPLTWPAEQQAQPQQEPVAWKLVPREPTHEMLKAMDECSTEGYDERLYAGHASSVYMAAVDAAPTPPAQRKPWVGLTPEQRATIAEANNMLVDDDLFDAIEAKLKEKNT